MGCREVSALAPGVPLPPTVLALGSARLCFQIFSLLPSGCRSPAGSFPLLKSVIPEVLPPLLLGSAFTSGGSVLEPEPAGVGSAGIGSAGMGKFLAAPQRSHPCSPIATMQTPYLSVYPLWCWPLKSHRCTSLCCSERDHHSPKPGNYRELNQGEASFCKFLPCSPKKNR